MILEKIRHGTKPKQTHVDMIAADIFSRCFGHCYSNWGPTAMQTHVPSSAVLSVRARVQTVTQGYPMFQLGPLSFDSQRDVPTLAYSCRAATYLLLPAMPWHEVLLQ